MLSEGASNSNATPIALASLQAIATSTRYEVLTKIEQALAIGDTSTAQTIRDNFSADSLANVENDIHTVVQIADDTKSGAIDMKYRQFYQLYWRNDDPLHFGVWMFRFNRFNIDSLL